MCIYIFIFQMHGIYLGSEEYVRKAVARSLRDLKVDTIDLYLIHTTLGLKVNTKSVKVSCPASLRISNLSNVSKHGQGYQTKTVESRQYYTT